MKRKVSGGVACLVYLSNGKSYIYIYIYIYIFERNEMN